MKSGMLILIAAAAMAIGATYGAVQGPSGEAAGGGKGASGTATAVLIPAGEPGEPLIVEGRVLSGRAESRWPMRRCICITPISRAITRRAARTSAIRARGIRGCAGI